MGDQFSGTTGSSNRFQQSIPHPLVIALSMIVSHVFLDGVPKRPFAQGDHAIQAF